MSQTSINSYMGILVTAELCKCECTPHETKTICEHASPAAWLAVVNS